VVGFGDASSDREAEAGAAGGSTAGTLLVAVEDMVAFGFGDAGAGVGDLEDGAA
jgi:hypothetical protein